MTCYVICSNNLMAMHASTLTNRYDPCLSIPDWHKMPHIACMQLPTCTCTALPKWMPTFHAEFQHCTCLGSLKHTVHMLSTPRLTRALTPKAYRTCLYSYTTLVYSCAYTILHSLPPSRVVVRVGVQLCHSSSKSGSLTLGFRV